MNKSLIVRFVFMGFLSLIVLSGVSTPLIISADSESNLKFCKAIKSSYEAVKTIKMVVTAYSSTVDQTDSTPFVTASGKHVEDGIVANNGLPFGTKIRIPELYGDRIFTVEDRMHRRKGIYHADIWFENYKEAKEFGAKITNIEIL